MTSESFENLVDMVLAKLGPDKLKDASSSSDLQQIIMSEFFADRQGLASTQAVAGLVEQVLSTPKGEYVADAEMDGLGVVTYTDDGTMVDDQEVEERARTAELQRTQAKEVLKADNVSSLARVLVWIEERITTREGAAAFEQTRGTARRKGVTMLQRESKRNVKASKPTAEAKYKLRLTRHKTLKGAVKTKHAKRLKIAKRERDLWRRAEKKSAQGYIVHTSKRGRKSVQKAELVAEWRGL